MLDSKQRHILLMADRTGDAAWISAVVEKLLATDPTITLDELEAALRAAAGAAYLVGTAERFDVVVGMSEWRRGRLKMTPEQNRALLAGEPT